MVFILYTNLSTLSTVRCRCVQSNFYIFLYTNFYHCFLSVVRWYALYQVSPDFLSISATDLSHVTGGLPLILYVCTFVSHMHFVICSFLILKRYFNLFCSNFFVGCILPVVLLDCIIFDLSFLLLLPNSTGMYIVLKTVIIAFLDMFLV